MFLVYSHFARHSALLLLLSVCWKSCSLQCSLTPSRLHRMLYMVASLCTVNGFPVYGKLYFHIQCRGVDGVLLHHSVSIQASLPHFVCSSIFHSIMWMMACACYTSCICVHTRIYMHVVDDYVCNAATGLCYATILAWIVYVCVSEWVVSVREYAVIHSVDALLLRWCRCGAFATVHAIQEHFLYTTRSSIYLFPYLVDGSAYILAHHQPNWVNISRHSIALAHSHSFPLSKSFDFCIPLAVIVYNSTIPFSVSIIFARCLLKIFLCANTLCFIELFHIFFFLYLFHSIFFCLRCWWFECICRYLNRDINQIQTKRTRGWTKEARTTFSFRWIIWNGWNE